MEGARYSDISDCSDNESDEGNLIIDESVNNNQEEVEEDNDKRQEPNLNDVADDEVEIQVLDLSINHPDQDQQQRTRRIEDNNGQLGGIPFEPPRTTTSILCCSAMETPPSVLRDEPGLAYYFNKKYLSDIKFMIGVGEQRKVLYGHKLVFGMKSAYFKTRFWNFGYQTDIIALGANPKTFERFMKCLYKKGESSKYFLLKAEGGIGMTHLVELCKIAYRLETKKLANKCAQTIINHVSKPAYEINKIFNLWQQLNVKLPGSRPLEFVEDFLDKNAAFLINTTEFLKLDQEYLTRFLSRDTLMVENELDLFKSTIRWAKLRCEKQGVPANQANIRQALGLALYQIRFLTMGYNNFLRAVCAEDVLTTNEMYQMKHWFLAVERNPELANVEYPPFIAKPRSRSTNTIQPKNNAPEPPTQPQAPYNSTGYRVVTEKVTPPPAAQPQPAYKSLVDRVIAEMIREPLRPSSINKRKPEDMTQPEEERRRPPQPQPAYTSMSIEDTEEMIVRLIREPLRAECIFFKYLVAITERLTAPGREPSFFGIEFLKQLKDQVYEFCEANNHHHFVTGYGYAV